MLFNMSTSGQQLHYIKNNLINRIGDKFPNEKIIGYEVTHSGGFDGFMSTIYELEIKTSDDKNKKEILHKLIAKFMKSDVHFRKSSKSYEQFSNEIFIYGKVLPYFEEILNNSLASSLKTLKGDKINKNQENKGSFNVKNWTPRTFYAEYGLIQGLSDGKTNESVLVLENLKPLGYRGGPKCFLDRQHLLLSVKILAEYHAFSYAMKINNDKMLQEFIEEIIPLSFVTKQNAAQSETIDYSTETVIPNKKLNERKEENTGNIVKNESVRKRKFATDDSKDIGNDTNRNNENKSEQNITTNSEKANNLYEVLYRIAFDRFFAFIDKLKLIKSNINDTNDQNENLIKFIKERNINNEFFKTLDEFKLRWNDKPAEILEYIRCNCVNNDNSENDVFSVILHGDFNRNNLLYQYDEPEGFKNPIGVKMIDFQELRFGTPAIDLAFHMYMNMEPTIRDEFWMELLTYYHNIVINTLANILNVEVEHKSLNQYRFEKFNEHFKKYAFYGALVCMHFLPWMTCSEEEVKKLSHHFETDMHSNDFRKISIEAGGDKSDKLITEIVQHAIKMGYMEKLLE